MLVRASENLLVSRKNLSSQETLFDVDLAPNRRRRAKPRFRFVDLFAGVGGFRLAMEANGGECVFSSEWDPFAQKTYQANFGDIPHGDITKVELSEIPRFDVLTAGFPCQPFSMIGKREGFAHKTQGTLFWDVLRIVRARRPAAVLLENVKGLVSHNGGDTMDTIIGALQEADYWTFWRILDAAEFGVPQHRERVYIVAFDKRRIRRPQFGWPRTSGTRRAIGRYIEKNVDGYSISRHLQRVYIHKADDGHPEIVDGKSDFAVKTLVASYHKIQRITGTFVKDGPTGLRLLTENECKAIMGFPRKFKIPVSRTQMYRQMGNSVAVPVVKKISREIAMTLLDAGVIKAPRKKRRGKDG
jgi:DNA (cytosine-5)-methyltransferase 1